MGKLRSTHEASYFHVCTIAKHYCPPGSSAKLLQILAHVDFYSAQPCGRLFADCADVEGWHAMLKAVREACEDQLMVDKMADDLDATKRPPRKTTPVEVLLKIVLVATETHFENRGLFDERRMDMALSNGKHILYKSHQETETRYVRLAYALVS